VWCTTACRASSARCRQSRPGRELARAADGWACHGRCLLENTSSSQVEGAKPPPARAFRPQPASGGLTCARAGVDYVRRFLPMASADSPIANRPTVGRLDARRGAVTADTELDERCRTADRCGQRECDTKSDDRQTAERGHWASLPVVVTASASSVNCQAHNAEYRNTIATRLTSFRAARRIFPSDDHRPDGSTSYMPPICWIRKYEETNDSRPTAGSAIK
jgi:hypothetical protein